MRNMLPFTFTYEKSGITRSQNFEERKNWVARDPCIILKQREIVITFGFDLNSILWQSVLIVFVNFIDSWILFFIDFNH